MSVTLINPFIVPAEKAEEFLQAWSETARQFSSYPGFIETHLQKNMGVGAGTFLYINIALWESVEAWSSAVGSYQPGEKEVAGVIAQPSLFQEAVAIKGTRQKDWKLCF